MGLREGSKILVMFYKEALRGVYTGSADLAGWVNLKDAEYMGLEMRKWKVLASEGDVAVNLNVARAVWTLPKSKKREKA